MKKNVFLLVWMMILGFVGYSQVPVFINPASQDVNPSEVFSTTVEISSVTNLGGFELDLAFDASLLQANSVTIGAFLGSSGRMVFPLTNSIDNTNGLLSFAATTLGASPPGPDGDGVLITIEWTATASVSNNETVDLLLQGVQLTEPNGTLIASETTDGSVTILGPLNTEVESQQACPGSVVVPLKVTKFEDITAFDITLNYTSGELSYINYQNADAQLSGLSVVDNGTNINITYAGSAVTIPNGNTLLELEFNAPDVFIQTVSNLEWDEASCSYTDINGAVTANYTNGTVTIDPLPASAGDITGSTSICQGQTAEAYNIAAVSNADSYIWALSPVDAGTINGNGTDITIDFLGTFSGSATLSVYASNTCGDGTTNSLQIESIPEPSVAAGDNISICESETVSLSATASNQQSVLWTTSGDGSFDDDASQTAIYTPGANDITNGTVTLSITATAMAPCGTDATDDLDVTITLAPSADAGADDGICEDPTYTLSGVAANYLSIQWSTSGDGGFDDDAILGATYTPGTNDIDAGQVTLTLTANPNTPCADSDTDDMVLTIGQVPTAAAGDDQEICEGETVSVSGTATHYQSVLWTSAGDGSFDDAASLAAVYTPGANDITNGTAVLTLTANEMTPCVTDASDDLTLTINGLPVAPTAVNASALTIYPGESSDLTYTGGNGTEFKWYTGSCGGELIATGNNISVSPITTTTYYGRWENNCGLSACEEITVTVDYHDVSVQISPATQVVSTAEVFTTQVEILNVTNLGGFELDLNFDENLLQANSVSLDGFLGSTGRSVFPLSNSIDNTNGLIEFAVTTLGATPPGPDGDGMLLTIEWTSVDNVANDVTTELTLNNLQVTTPNGTLIPTNVYQGEVTIIGAVTTKVLSQTTCAGAVTVPVEVTSFKDVTSFDIVLDYVPAELSYTGFSNVNALLTGVTVTDNAGSLTMSYSGAAVTIGNGDILLDLEFTAPSNVLEVVSNLTWDDNISEYNDANGLIDAVYTDGTVSIGADLSMAGDITGASTVCQGDLGEVFSIDAIAFADNYSWGISPAAAGTISGSGESISIDFASDFSGEATLSVFATNECGDGAPNNIIIDVIAKPIVSAGSGFEICETATAQLAGTASNQASVLWTTAGDGSFDDASLLAATYTPGTNDITNGNVTLTLKAFAMSPCSPDVSDDMLLTIQVLPTVAAGDDATICEGSTYTLNGSVSDEDSYVWSSLGDGSFDDASLLTAEYTPGVNDIAAGSVELTLTAQSQTPCVQEASDALTLNITLSPIVEAGQNGSICEGSAYTLEGVASNYAEITWSTAGDGSFDNIHSLTANYTPGAADVANGGVDLTLTATANSPCIDDDDIMHIDVNSLPLPPTTIVASSPLIYPGESTTLSYTGGEGATFNWYTGSCGGINIGTGNDLVVSPVTTTTYYGRWENDCGLSACEEVTVTVDYHDVTVQISPASQMVSTAQIFTTQVEILNVTNLGGFELDLDFDETLLQANSVTLDGFLGSSGRSVFPLSNNIDNTNGLIEFAVTTLGATPPGPDGDGMLLTIEWTSVDNVADDITTSLILNNLQVATPDGTLIPVNIYHGDVTIIGAVSTSIISQTSCPGSVIVPIEVTSFKDVVEFSLELDYTSAEMIFVGYQNANALLSNVDVVDNGNSIVMSYIGAATTIPNATTLIELEFNALENTTEVISNLSWNLANSSYTDGDGLMDVAFDDGSVTIDPIPGNAGDITGLTTVCQGLAAELYTISAISNATAYTWEISPADAGSITPNNTDLSVDFSGTYSGQATITVFATNTCGVGVSNSITVDVIAYPTAAAGDDATICEDVTYTCQGVATDQQSVLWTTSGDGTFDDATALNAIYTPSANDILAGTVTLEMTAYSIVPCATDATDNMVLTIQSLPTADAGADDAICEDATYALNGLVANNSAILWETSGDGTFDDDASLTAIYTPGTNDIANGSATLSLTAVAIGPCADNFTDDMVLTIEINPSADAGIDDIICDNATYTLAGIVSNEQSHLWTTSGDGSFDDAGLLNATYTPGSNDIANGNVDLTLTAYAVSPCSNDAVDFMNLVIQNLPSVNAGSDGDVCEGETYTLNGTAQNYQTLTWSTAGDGSFDDVNSLTAVYTHGPNDLANGNVVLTLSVDSPCGATDDDDMLLTVQGAATVDAGDDAIICDIETYTLSGIATYQGSVLWTTDGDGSFDDATMLGATYTPGANDIANEGATLTLTAYAIAPCSNDVTDDMLLEIYGVPTADAGVDATICEDGVFETQAAADNYVTLTWSTDGDGSFDDPTALNAIYTPGSNDIAMGSVVLSLYVATPCGANDSDDMTLSISGLPNVYAGYNDAVCEGNNYQLDANAENPASILWTTSGDGSFVDASIEDAVYIPGANDLNNGEVTLTITITPMAPCSSDVSDDMVLEVIHNPEVDAGSNGIVCENGSAQLYGYAGYYNSFEWSTSGDGTFDNPNSLFAEYTPGSQDIINSHAILTLSVYPIAPCEGVVTDELVMSVIPLPESNAGQDGEICADEAFMLNGMVDNEYAAIWSTSGDGYFEDGSNPETQYFPGMLDVENGSVVLTLTAVALVPCSEDAVDDMELLVNPIISEVSTPEGPEEVDTYYTPQSEYVTSSEFATYFNWSVYPPIAGSIMDANSTTIVTWNENFQGIAYIYVKAINDCNILVSDSLEVLVNNSVGIDQVSENKRVRVIPNPNQGDFELEITGVKGDVQCEISNSNGAVVHFESFTDVEIINQKLAFDLTSVASGVYYLRLTNKDEVIIKKFIINN